MKISEIREMSLEDIRSQVVDARDELMRLRFQKATGELTDFNQLSATRQKIARMLTVLNERGDTDQMEVEGAE
jgi:large subunit ribosomal protein L29